ncbi:unnamed protein product [Discosporangium mesarthrocarpum]
MALSLVGDYGASSDEEESSNEEEVDEKEEKNGPEKMKIALPSAADLFDSVDGASFMSTSAPDPTPSAMPTKRKGSPGNAGSAALKGTRGNAAGNQKGDAVPRSQGLIPPQMSRPNIVTEDVGAWSSDTAVKRQRHKEAEKQGDKKGKGEQKSYKQREKARKLTLALSLSLPWPTGSIPGSKRRQEKRDKGQASRGKSYVEEEKRILREMGST